MCSMKSASREEEPRGAYAASVLGAELCQGGALDVAEVRDGDDHLVVGIEVLGVEVAGEEVDAGAALVAVLVADLDELLFHDAAAGGVVLQDVAQVGDLLA